MLILSRVCAEFHDAHGNPLFSVSPLTRNIFVEAPDAIREDPLFRMLLNDGSLEAAVPEERKKILEQDPAAGHDAAGRALPSGPEGKPEKPEEKPAKAAAGKFARGTPADENHLTMDEVASGQ